VFFRRVPAGEQPGFPRLQRRNRYHAFTYKECGNGARPENGSLVCSKIGQGAVRWSRPVAGTPRPSRGLQRGGRGVRVLLVCAGAHPARAAYRTRDRHCYRTHGSPQHGRRGDRRAPAPLPHGG
jgi:hypothetical protein